KPRWSPCTVGRTSTGPLSFASSRSIAGNLTIGVQRGFRHAEVARCRPRFLYEMTTKTLGACAIGRENNFDVLRLLGATLVLASHSFVVTGAAEPRIGHWPLGTFGVQRFFAISGFLIAMSWLRRPSLRGFAVRRALRI